MSQVNSTVQRWGAITNDNQTIVHRVVGTLEYFSALRNLDAFMQIASEDEVEAADRIVSSRPQYDIHTNIAARFQDSANTQLQTPNRASSVVQRGLKWVIALARVEAGAILATFTAVTSPFEIVAPTRWEQSAYQELLMDGAQTHFLALGNDANFPIVASKTPDTETLAYLRRISLARAMLMAAARSNMHNLSAQNWSQLVAQDKQLLEYGNQITNKVRQYVASLNSAKAYNGTLQSNELKSMLLNGCGLIQAQNELAAGKAKVQTFDFRKNR